MLKKESAKSVPSWIEGSQMASQPESPKRAPPVDKFPLTVCVREWDCEKSGASFMRRRKKARVRIQLKRDPANGNGSGKNGYRDLEEGSSIGDDWSELIEQGDIVLFHLLKPIDAGDYESSVLLENDAISVGSASTISTMGFRGVDDFNRSTPAMGDGWKAKVSVPISKVSLKLDNLKCIASFAAGGIVKHNILYFSSDEEAKQFLLFVKRTKQSIRKHAEKAIRNDTFSNITDNSPLQPIKFLIEIISATDLKAEDKKTSDPYVVVKYGGEEIHKTKVIKKNLHPIWTVETKALFIFTLMPEDYYTHDVVFEVRDWDAFNPGSTLGQCLLSPKKMIMTNGERIECKLQYLQMGKDAQGYLAIRCKKASESDVEFVNLIESKEIADGDYYSDYVTPTVGQQNRNLRMKKKENGTKYHLARPVDKVRGEMWMTPDEIEKSAYENSDYWTEVGKGDLGSLFVEVIGCNDLPRLDRGLGGRQKSDAFVTAVYEDAVATTDVVMDCLNPRFLPHTQRAFKFNLSSIHSPLFIGVHDFDAGLTMHDPAGRITVPLQKFVPKTTYTITQDLYDSHEIVSERESRGSITLRIRLELKEQRALFFNALKSVPKTSVHLNNKKNYAHAKYAVRGALDVNQYDFKVFLSLIDELLQYHTVLYIVKDALKSLILWRSNHSMVMLCFVVVFTECPKYTPSLIIASVAWLMLALLGNERNRPSPWDNPPSYSSLLMRFITNKARPVNIKKFQRSDDDKDYSDRLRKLEEGHQASTNDFWEETNKEWETFDIMSAAERKESARHGSRTGKRKKEKFDLILKLLKPVLEPVQLTTLPIVMILRFVRDIAKWDQMYLSFWITTTAIFLTIVSGIGIYFIKDWDFIILWAKRIILYGTLSPLNKVVDIFYFSKFDAMSESQKEALTKEKRRRKRSRFHGNFATGQRQLEDYMKEEAVKTLMFGPHVITIPSLMTPDRYQGIPNAESYAEPTSHDTEKLMQPSKTFHGQGMGMENSNGIVPANYLKHSNLALLPKMRKATRQYQRPSPENGIEAPLLDSSKAISGGGTFDK